MSGVYISGMEMPTACCACPCNYDNVCAVTNQFPTFEEWYESKPSWCPLVPVSEHGRLIDLNVLREGKFVTPLSPFERGWNDAIDTVVEYTTTIIPADKDGA